MIHHKYLLLYRRQQLLSRKSIKKQRLKLKFSILRKIIYKKEVFSIECSFFAYYAGFKIKIHIYNKQNIISKQKVLGYE